jgi:hypothetical protein
VKGNNYKKHKNVKHQKVRKSRVVMIVHRRKLFKNNFGHTQNYNLNMQVFCSDFTYVMSTEISTSLKSCFQVATPFSICLIMCAYNFFYAFPLIQFKIICNFL